MKFDLGFVLVPNKYTLITMSINRIFCCVITINHIGVRLYSLRSYLQDTNYFLDTLNNLCIWFRFLTRYIHYSMYLKSQLYLINRSGGSKTIMVKL